MLGDLSFLIKLQELDNATDVALEGANAFKPLIKEKTLFLETLKNNLKVTKEKLSSNQLKKKQLELDVDVKEKEIQKHNGALNSLKSNDAYKGMLTEIQTAKDGIASLEDQILAVMESIEKDERDYKAYENRFKSEEGLIRVDIQKLESNLALALETVEKKKAERDAYALTVPPTLLSRYDTIREKGGGLAIVPINENSCTGCRMSLTHNKVIEVKRAKDMVLCDSCTRILYVKVEAVVPPVESPSSQPA